MKRDGVEIKTELRKFITSRYMNKFGGKKLSSSDSFLEKGIVDSIGVIELAAFIQRQYGIKIKPPEIVPENFDTIDNLERFILKKSK